MRRRPPFSGRRLWGSGILTCAVLCLFALSGCGGEKKLVFVPVEGKVEYLGKPVTNVMLTLVPLDKDGKWTDVPVVEKDGTFATLCPAGTYQVVVLPKGQAPLSPVPANSPIPAIYQDSVRSPLILEVPKEGLFEEIILLEKQPVPDEGN